jgi:putative transposase
MPRAARVVFLSMPYHIISRGNNRESVFQEKEDFEKYLEICRRYKDRMNSNSTIGY